MIIGSVAMVVVLCFTFLAVVGFTTPPIEKISVDSYGRGLAYVGGEFSHADTMYVDYRPTLEDKEKPSDVWMAEGNEWRRLEGRKYNGYQFTLVVLRDKAFKDSRFGIGRDEPGSKAYQAKFDRIVADYKAQSIFNRVWRWRVQER